jgi:hypothetical protein
MKIALWISAILLAAVPARPDTVTKTDHTSVNGSLIQMSGGTVTLQARFGTSTQTVSIAMGEVGAIEFNQTTYNPGAPPKALNSASSVPKPATTADVLVLRGGQRKDCDLISIDQRTVHCAGKNADSTRNVTLRILVNVR